MLDYDVIIIGGGPAGLTAGLYLSRGKYRTLLLEKESPGGQIKKVETIENYPGFAEGVGGPQLASEMTTQAAGFGLEIEAADVSGLELYSGCRCVQCADGRSFTTNAVIVSSGCQRRKLGILGESELAGKGVIECALCDGSQFAGKVVAVCGGGDSGITEALYLSKIASKIIVLEAMPKLNATPVLQERVRENGKIEIYCGTRVGAILGSEHVEAIEFEDVMSRKKTTLKTDGVLVDIGLEPNISFVENLVDLDAQRQIVVNERFETSVPNVFAIGDIRANSPRQVVTAVGDGASAAICVQRLLREQ